MKKQLIKHLIEQVKMPNKFKVDYLMLDGIDLEINLKYYLSSFTIGILDPDIAGKSPDRFVKNLIAGCLGEFSKRYILLAYDKNEAVGILIGLPQGHQLHIYSLHTSPSYRNKGVGSELLSKCINDMFICNIKDIILDVHNENIPARSFYNKFNFEELNII